MTILQIRVSVWGSGGTCNYTTDSFDYSTAQSAFMRVCTRNCLYLFCLLTVLWDCWESVCLCDTYQWRDCLHGLVHHLNTQWQETKRDLGLPHTRTHTHTHTHSFFSLSLSIVCMYILPTDELSATTLKDHTRGSACSSTNDPVPPSSMFPFIPVQNENLLADSYKFA